MSINKCKSCFIAHEEKKFLALLFLHEKTLERRCRFWQAAMTSGLRSISQSTSCHAELRCVCSMWGNQTFFHTFFPVFFRRAE